MKKQSKILLIALCILTILCVIAFASCQDEQITVTVNLNLPDTDNQTFTVDKNAEFYSMLASYVPSNTDGLTFAGWVDDNGNEVTSSTRWDKDGVVQAQWKVSYVEEVYVEKYVDGSYVYVLESTSTQEGILGASVSMQSTYDEAHYVIDYTQADCVINLQSLTKGVTLKAYYCIQRLTVLYVDDSAQDTVRYGDTYTIRTPEQDGSASTLIVSYCSSPSGDGTEYKFGQTVTLTNNLILYPVTVDVFTDVDDSGDVVQINANVTGKGAVVLIKDGVRYEGFVNKISDSFTTFDVTVGETELHGKLLAENKFVYRNEDEVGTYLLGDYLFPDDGVSAYAMLALDGYGTGVYSYMIDEERAANYFVSYQQTDKGDYHMYYYLPAEPDKVYEGWFDIVRTEINGADQIGENIVGYFLLCGEENGGYFYVENGSLLSEYVLTLDGYGNAVYYYWDGEDYQIDGTGYYLASDEYTYESPEYVLYMDDKSSSLHGNLFIVFTEVNPGTGEAFYLFSFKHDEAGSYYQNEGSAYPELYLNGYGLAVYYSSDSDEGSLGSYTIQTVAGGYEVYVTFYDDYSSTLRAVVNAANSTFVVKDSSFRVDENGVLTEYFGNSAVIVIPATVDDITVTEIADNVFNTQANGKYYTSVTLPETITVIGERAFQNDHYLRTVYIAATTPPVLGLNAFHWMRSDLRIVVPDGQEDAYRNAESWAPYAQYITSEYELAHKPVFEIVDGVLKSYNPTDTTVANVTIPDEVTAIANGVFAYREYITSVNLNNVTVIGDNAFDSCVNLTSVTFNQNTVSIGKQAFFRCVNLTQVDLGNVQTIGDGAFNCCYSLSKVNIGSSITQIGTMAFAYCANELDEQGETTAINEIAITIAATSAPAMASNVFVNSAPRIYVSSYEVGVSYAQDENANWSTYVRYLRVKNQGQNLTFYSVANMANELVLDDRATYGESIIGLYKWDGNTLTVAWLNRDSFTGNFTVDIYPATFNSANGELRGLQYENEVLVFVTAGTVVTYARGDETLTVKFGTDEATFNGNAVTMEIVNYRMQFDYDGYTYALTLYNSNEFSYKRSKIVVTKTYSAQDGANIKVEFGDYIKATGTVKNVDGKGLNITVEIDNWYLTQVDDNVYTWVARWQSDKYLVTATLNDEGNTFTYSVGPFSSQTRYNNGSDYVIVTAYTDGHLEMHFAFITVNGDLQCNVMTVTPVQGQSNEYSVTISIMVDVYDEEGNKIGETPSVFDGDYTITLNSADSTYTLQRVQNA